MHNRIECKEMDPVDRDTDDDGRLKKKIKVKTRDRKEWES